MTGFPFGLAKITPPSFPNLLSRPRLLRRLELSRDKKLTLIVGQAAQGKSALAASFAGSFSAPTAWLNLSPEDSDSVNLFRLLVQSLAFAFENKDLDFLLDYPATKIGPKAEIPSYHEWANRLFEQIDMEHLPKQPAEQRVLLYNFFS